MTGALNPRGRSERQIGSGVAITNDAVVIAKVTLSTSVVPCMWSRGRPTGRPYQPVPPFQPGDDWLQNVTIHHL